MFEVVSVDRLADAVDADREFTLVDTRPVDSYESWRVPGAVSFPFGPTEALSNDRLDEFADIAASSDTVYTICGKGVTSANLAVRLSRAGYDEVYAVSGGMRDWNDIYETAAFEPDDDLVVVQFQRRGKGCLSYLVGSRSAGEAVIVDPGRHTDQYLAAAAARGLQITQVLDTHVHADHISGGQALAHELGVPYRLGERASERDVELGYEPIADGETVAVGTTDLTAHATPGHTSELLSYRLGDVAVFTGDSLFVDSVGRTELQFGESGAADGARLAYDTLHDVFGEMAGDLQVLPGHVHVAPDGTWGTGTPNELVGRRLDEVLDGLDLYGLDEETFVERMTGDLPEKPPNYERVIDINRGWGEAADDLDAVTLETGRNNCAV
ncbi:MBL fold metallo-hydrolase [Halobaculum limi]|uniref:MBL fold metallo-hydrolase n=1 Tax=Halobaculum limi TaxID=3031916 RepID=UPI0024053A7B|nr:MBL fold metallo-hydrolase [Halobaculum sp. YSMS11]